jgi:hypothetical protein
LGFLKVNNEIKSEQASFPILIFIDVDGKCIRGCFSHKGVLDI